MILLFLTSGLFLGWSLGANDASNIFGSAVGSRMISFRNAAIIASLFVILGAVLQGSGASVTLGKLGSVNALGGSFTVALAAGVTVYLMTKFSLPVSTTQAIVGAIIGWNLFTGNPTNLSTLTQIISTWITGPALGAVFAVLLYMILKSVKKNSSIHLIRFESYVRTGLVIVGAFGAYSLGANNIANVMGVFVPAFNLNDLDLGIITLSSSQQLFLLGGIAIATGILTYSNRVMEVVGNQIMELSSDAALIVVLAQALVLFIFSSSAFSSLVERTGLPPFPMVPVSSTQVIIGAIIGIGLYKGARNINFRVVGDIAMGWVLTPVASGLTAFFSLFFVKNIFNINVGTIIAENGGPAIQKTASSSVHSISEIMGFLITALLAIGIVTVILYYSAERKKKNELRKSEEKFWSNLK